MTENRQTVLITGAAGFLGTYLAELCAKTGILAVGLDLNPPHQPRLWHDFHRVSCESPDVAELLRKHKFSSVFHLAGGASVPVSVQNPYQDFTNFIPGTANLALKIAKEQPECSLVLFSSAAVYGDPAFLPIDESAPLHPLSAYGAHKALGEALLQHYARLYGLSIRIIRVFSAYGPGLRKQIMWDICQKAFAAVRSSNDGIELFGTGRETRDFIHARDVARAALLVSALPASAPTMIFNVASGVETHIADLAHLIVGKIDPRLEIRFSGTIRLGDPSNWRANISKIVIEGFECSTTINEGVAEVVEWAKDVTWGEQQDRFSDSFSG